MDYEDEIDILEGVLSDLESAIRSIKDSPYHSYLAQGWELDKEEIESRLDILHSKQNDRWKAEIQQQNIEYERSRL